MTPDDLLKAMETLCDAPGGIERLRELVLQLAVRGRLVPQDPEDEPASELLERISEVRKNRGEKSAKYAPIDETEIAFTIPTGWEWARYAQVCDSRLGKMLDKSKNQGSLRPYLRNTNVQWFKFVLDDLKELRIRDDELDECTVEEGDVIICEGGEPGRCAVGDERVCGMVYQKALHRCRPLGGVVPWYIAYLLRCDATSGRLRGRFTGATIKHLTGRSLALHSIPLPPLAEQHRIVAKVDELMGLLDELEQAKNERDAHRAAFRDSALAALQDAEDAEAVQAAWARIAANLDDLFTEPEDVAPLRQTILQLAVRGRLVPQDPEDEPASKLLDRLRAEKERLLTEKRTRKPKALPPLDSNERRIDVPPTWARCQADDLLEFVTSGSRGWAKYYSDSGPIFLRIGNLQYNSTELDLRRIQRVSPPEGAESRRTRAAAGDILISVTGDTGMIGLIPQDVGDAHINQHIAMCRPLPSTYAQYLAMQMTSMFVLSQLWGAQRGIKNSLGLNDVRMLDLAIPPEAEQRRIVAKVDELMAICDELEQRLTEARDHQAAFAAAAVHHLDLEASPAEVGAA